MKYEEILKRALEKYKSPIMVNTVPGKGSLFQAKNVIQELGLIEHTIDFLFPTGQDLDYMFIPFPGMNSDGTVMAHEPGFMNMLHNPKSVILILGIDNISLIHMNGLMTCLFSGKDINAKVVFIDYRDEDEYIGMSKYDSVFTNRLFIIDNK